MLRYLSLFSGIGAFEKAGYHNYWKVLNAKDYGIPQNRERVFIVSIRKDIDHNIFEFPKPYSLEKRLKDFLEPHVENKSLFTETQAKMFTKDGNVKRYIGSDVVDEFKEGQCADISFPNGYNKGNRVFNECPTINTTTTQSSFCVKVNDEINDIGNYSPSGHHTSRIVDSEGIAPIVTENHGTVTATTVNIPPLRIRKLTPKECYRLMGFSDEDFEKSESVPTSNTQLYKQAGNSICVPVLEAIFKKLFKKELKYLAETN